MTELNILFISMFFKFHFIGNDLRQYDPCYNDIQCTMNGCYILMTLLVAPCFAFCAGISFACLSFQVEIFKSGISLHSAHFRLKNSIPSKKQYSSLKRLGSSYDLTKYCCLIKCKLLLTSYNILLDQKSIFNYDTFYFQIKLFLNAYNDVKQDVVL